MQYGRMLCSAAALGLAALGGGAEASAVIDIKQHGHNLDATGSGTINLNGLTFVAQSEGVRL